MPLDDPFGTLARVAATRAAIANRPEPVDPQVSCITVNCKTLERTVERGVPERVVHQRPNYARIAKETIERLQRENDALRRALQQKFPGGRVITPDEVATAFLAKLWEAGITIDGEPYSIHDLKGKKATKKYAKPRHVCVWLCTRLCIRQVYSLPKLGWFFGNRDHSSIMHSRDHVESAFEWNPALRVIADGVIAELGAEP